MDRATRGLVNLCFNGLDVQYRDKRKAETVRRNELKREFKRLSFIRGWGAIGDFFGFRDRRTAKKHLFANPFISFTGNGKGQRVIFDYISYVKAFGVPISGWRAIMLRYGFQDFRTAKRRLRNARRLDYSYRKPIIHVPLNQNKLKNA